MILIFGSQFYPTILQSNSLYPLQILIIMYDKPSSLTLKIIQFSNLTLTLAFLLLFLLRLRTLHTHSSTNRYKKYFPKLRTLFSILYILLSLTLIIYNLLTNSYGEAVWYQYIIQGGGGQCIDSIILLIQLKVLRLQLIKQQPYTIFHLYFFVYLTIVSLARIVLTFIDVASQQNDIANAVIAALLLADSLGQLVYWLKKRQSLPQFIQPNASNFDQVRYHSQLLLKRRVQTKRCVFQSMHDNFPYLIPFVSLIQGKINISLQRITQKQKQKKKQNQQHEHLNDSFTDRELSSSMYRQNIIKNNSFTIKQIKRFYIMCGRIPLQTRVQFQTKTHRFISQLQLFLDELFSKKRCYQTNILKFLNLQPQIIQQYALLFDKQFAFAQNSQIDPTIGLPIISDQNYIYASVNCYRCLWVDRHCQFYMKVTLNGHDKASYPIKKYQAFQQFYLLLKKIIRIQDLRLQLPYFCKIRAQFLKHPQQLQEIRQQLQYFIRNVVNDSSLILNHKLHASIMQFIGFSPTIIPLGRSSYPYHKTHISKNQIKKTLIHNDYITFYQFKMQLDGKIIHKFTKRYSQFQQLYNDLQRWRKNNKMVIELPCLPQKIIYKSEQRFQGLCLLLNRLMEIRGIGEVYAFNSFVQINLQGRTGDGQNNSVYTKETARQRQTTVRSQDHMNVLNKNAVDRRSGQTQNSYVFSKMLDDLGNQDYD